MKTKNKVYKGMTIMEMLVAIAIFSIGLEGCVLLFSRTFKTNSYVMEMGQSSLAVSQGINKVLNYVRGARQADNGAYPIKSASDNDLVVYSDYDKDDVTERLHFYKYGQEIMMGVTDPTSGTPKIYPSGDQQTISIAHSIVNNDETPVFYYYNKNYPGDVSHNPMGTPAVVSDVRLIKVYLQINIDPNRAPDNIEMQSFVEIRNLNDYDRIR